MGRHKWAIIFSLCLAAFTVYISLDTFVLSSTYQTDATEMNLSMFEGLEGSEKTVLNDESGLEKGDSSKKPSMSKSIPRRSESESDSDTEGNSSKKPSGFSKMPYSGFGKSRKHSDSSTEEEKDKDPSGSTENSEKAELVADGKSGTYSDGNICITLKEYRYEDTSVYAADIKLTSAVYLKTAFAQDTYGKNITAKTSDIAEEKNAVLAINGDYYGAREKGCVIRNGVAYREAEGDDDILCIYADGSFKIASPKDVTAAELVEDGVWQAFSFGPALIEDGTITVSKGDEVGRAMASNPRTAIGVIDKLHYVFVVADGRTGESEGLTLSELANFMKELGATTAYNLDGGGSSSMVFEGEQINIPTTNGSSIKERSVSDIVYIG